MISPYTPHWKTQISLLSPIVILSIPWENCWPLAKLCRHLNAWLSNRDLFSLHRLHPMTEKKKEKKGGGKGKSQKWWETPIIPLGFGSWRIRSSKPTSTTFQIQGQAKRPRNRVRKENGRGRWRKRDCPCPAVRIFRQAFVLSSPLKKINLKKHSMLIVALRPL